MPESNKPGLETFSWIWESQFCPIIVYSAQPDLIPEDMSKHPFIRTVQKGQNSDEQVKALLDALRPQMEAISEVEGLFLQAFSSCMRDVAPYAFKTYSSESEADKRKDLIVRMGRRRVAALADEQTQSGPLASWEQYIFPPVSSDLRLADILRKSGESADNPAAFRIILTPSCDLSASNNRKPKVVQVLVAQCCSISEGLRGTSLSRYHNNGQWSFAKLKDQVQTVLNQGYLEPIIPLPALAGEIPEMVANLHKLELIPLEAISSRTGEFERIASVDSPFRELVAWAYMRVGCRLGLPERDCGKWCEEIIEKMKKESAGGNQS